MTPSRFTPAEQHLLDEFEDILRQYAADPELRDGLAGACLAIVHQEQKHAVEEARHSFFAAVAKAGLPYIGNLRRLWIQSVS